MAVRSNKIFIPNEVYFITFTILGWQNIFVNDRYCNLIYKWFDYMKNNYGNKVYGYCIMPNHIHLLIKITERSPKLSTLIQNAKRFLAYGIITLLKADNSQKLLQLFTDNARIKQGAKHKVFQDKYDSLLISSQKFFLEKLNYTHKNPCVKHWRLADKPESYRYSSASNYILGQGFYEVELMDF